MTVSHRGVLLQPTAEGQMAVFYQTGKSPWLTADKQLGTYYAESATAEAIFQSGGWAAVKAITQSPLKASLSPGNFCHCPIAPAALPLLGTQVPGSTNDLLPLYRSSF